MKRHTSKPKSSATLRNEGNGKRKSTLSPQNKKRNNSKFYDDFDDDFNMEELDKSYLSEALSFSNFDDDEDDDY